jgi:hypothetical protein
VHKMPKRERSERDARGDDDLDGDFAAPSRDLADDGGSDDDDDDDEDNTAPPTVGESHFGEDGALPPLPTGGAGAGGERELNARKAAKRARQLEKLKLAQGTRAASERASAAGTLAVLLEPALDPDEAVVSFWKAYAGSTVGRASLTAMDALTANGGLVGKEDIVPGGWDVAPPQPKPPKPQGGAGAGAGAASSSSSSAAPAAEPEDSSSVADESVLLPRLVRASRRSLGGRTAPSRAPRPRPPSSSCARPRAAPRTSCARWPCSSLGSERPLQNT